MNLKQDKKMVFTQTDGDSNFKLEQVETVGGNFWLLTGELEGVEHTRKTMLRLSKELKTWFGV